MNTIKRCILFSFILFGTALLADDSAKPTVDFTDMMSDTEFAEAGLDTLTPEQQAVLNELFRKYTSEEIKTIREEAKQEAIAEIAQKDKSGFMGLEQITNWIDFNSPERIETSIVGPFKGWSGKTFFKLENGQVWQQRTGGKVNYRKSMSPKVEIFKTIGGYRMRVEGYRQTVGIKRIR